MEITGCNEKVLKLLYYLFLTVIPLSIILMYHLSERQVTLVNISDQETLLHVKQETLTILNKSDHIEQETLLTEPLSSLSKDLIGRIKTFVLFIGKERSGSSIVGALMNAHPHMAIAHEYHVLRVRRGITFMIHSFVKLQILFSTEQGKVIL